MTRGDLDRRRTGAAGEAAAITSTVPLMIV